jgi:hypothetical protein
VTGGNRSRGRGTRDKEEPKLVLKQWHSLLTPFHVHSSSEVGRSPRIPGCRNDRRFVFEWIRVASGLTTTRSSLGWNGRAVRSSNIHRGRPFGWYSSRPSFEGHSSLSFFERRMADRVGFEPTVTLLPHTLSKRAHSTTLTPVRDSRGREPSHLPPPWQSEFPREIASNLPENSTNPPHTRLAPRAQAINPTPTSIYPLQTDPPNPNGTSLSFPLVNVWRFSKWGQGPTSGRSVAPYYAAKSYR